MRAFPLVAFVLLWSTAHAQRVDTIPGLDRLAAEPGAEVTRNANGDVAAVTLTRNGVVIRSERQGEQDNTVAEDRSGHGAVLCSWSIYIETRTTLDTCFPGRYPELHQALDAAINRINGFIVANNLVPTSLKAVEADVAARDTADKTRSSRLGPDGLARACAGSDAAKMVILMAHQTADDWQKAVTDLISLPRPPVMNPCL